MRAIGVCFAAFSLAASASAAPPSQANNPLVLKAQGNFYVGGTIELRSPNTTNAALPGDGVAAGHIAVNQAYVQYQIPVSQKYKYPIVLMHGGGHTANIFMSTPDGREGWYTSLTRRGFAVYAVDGPNRGRSGWDPTARIQATVGLAPASSMEQVNIYTKEEAWTGFRWGPTSGTFYANTQFPKAYVDDYIRQIQPAYRNLPPPAEQVQII
jgi:pimeloyl-ACP methyl ester carboxylesterase